MSFRPSVPPSQSVPPKLHIVGQQNALINARIVPCGESDPGRMFRKLVIGCPKKKVEHASEES
jgi:hypothetical protein